MSFTLFLSLVSYSASECMCVFVCTVHTQAQKHEAYLWLESRYRLKSTCESLSAEHQKQCVSAVCLHEYFGSCELIRNSMLTTQELFQSNVVKVHTEGASALHSGVYYLITHSHICKRLCSLKHSALII